MTGWVAYDWSDPYYYDYDDDGKAYVDGEEVGAAEENADQAIQLAASAPEVDEDDGQWMPLGVFAVSTDEETEPVMLLQLAVSKEGAIGGTYHNTAVGTALPVKGKIDPKAQRAAWTMGNYKNTVMETGIFNLTQDESPLLVHFGKDRTQKWLLVRLEEPRPEPNRKAPTTSKTS